MFEAFRKRQKKWWCSRSNLPQTTFLDGKTLFLVLMKAPYMDGRCLRESYWQQFSAWSATGNAFLIFLFYFTEKKRIVEKLRRRKGLACHLRDSKILLKDGFLLEWSFKRCLPPAWRQTAGQHRGELCPLCGGKLLGLRPYPLLIVHPVLTGIKRQWKHYREVSLEKKTILPVLFAAYAYQ